MARNIENDAAAANEAAEVATEETAPATPTRRRRKVTAAQTAPKKSTPARSRNTAEEPAAETADAVAAEPEEATAPVAKKPARRSRKKVSPKVEELTASNEEASQDAAESVEEPAVVNDPEVLEVAEAHAAPKRRRKVTADVQAPEAAPAPEPVAAAKADDDEDEAEENLDAAAAVQAPEGETEKEPEEQRLPAASLLFQAPDPTRAKRRRRKVTAVTQAPETAPAAAEPERDVQTQAATDPETAASSDAAPAPAKRRRRKVTAAAQAPEAAPTAAQPERAASEDAPEEAENEDAQEETSEEQGRSGRKRRRGGRGRRSRTRSEEASAASADEVEEETPAEPEPSDDEEAEPTEGSSRRRRRRRSRSRSERAEARDVRDEIAAPKGSTRLEAKRQRRREGRAAGRRRPIVTEAEFLARRESVDRQMIVREQDGLNQIAVLEDGLLVEHYVARHTQASMVGNVYIGRVQNVLPSMEAAFVDLGKGRNAVLYAGEVNWDTAGMEGKPRRIEEALSSGDTVLVQVTKDPIGHKGARLTSQVTLAGRYLVLVPGGTMTGISRKLPDTERARLKKILKKVVPDDAGVIVRTAAEGASEEQLAADVERLVKQWESIDKKAKQVLSGSGKAPVLLKGEPELAVRVVRDVFNEDFKKLIVSGPEAWATISEYVTELSPDLADRLVHWVQPEDVFTAHRVDEQLAKGFDRKVWLPSGGTLIIDRTEAMTVIDVNTGRFTGGAGGTLEETVTRNNIEAAEEIVRQLRLRDIGGMVVIDFVDMVLESNRDLVLRRLVECLGRDRTRHQVTEVTSLGLVQMTRKRVGQGLVEAFSTPCDCCGGRGFIVHDDPVENQQADMSASAARPSGRGRGRKGQDDTPASGRKRSGADKAVETPEPVDDAARAATRDALAQIAAAAEQAHKDKDAAAPAEAAEPADAPVDTAAPEVAPASKPRRRRKATAAQKAPEPQVE